MLQITFKDGTSEEIEDYERWEMKHGTLHVYDWVQYAMCKRVEEKAAYNDVKCVKEIS